VIIQWNTRSNPQVFLGFDHLHSHVTAATGVSPPVFSGTIPDISVTESTGTHSYDLSTYFTGATSYSISPSVEAGWSFNTSTAELVIDTDDTNSFGPYTVTGTNAGGSDNSNAFDIAVTAAVVDTGYRGGGSSGRYYTWAPEELPKGDFVRKYEKTAKDDELERLLKEAIQRDLESKKAAHIASVAAERVTSVQDIARAADHVGKEVLKLQQTHKISQDIAQKRLRRLKDEEDIIISILLSEI